MAVQPYTETVLQAGVRNRCVLIATWSNLANGDTGAPLDCSTYADRVVQFDGTLGAGGNLIVEGSVDGVLYYTLTDLQGIALSLAALTLKSVAQITRFIRPRISAGDGTTLLSLKIQMRGRF